MIKFSKNWRYLKTVVKIIKKCIIVFFVLIFIYLLSLILVSCIPKSFVEENIKESDKYFYVSDADKWLYISGFTDAIMLDINYRIDSHNPVESALKSNVIADENAGIEPLLRI